MKININSKKYIKKMVKLVKEEMNQEVKEVLIKRIKSYGNKGIDTYKFNKILADSLSEVFPEVEFHNLESKRIMKKPDDYIESWSNIIQYSELKRLDFFLPSAYREDKHKRKDDKGKEYSYIIKNNWSGYESATLSSYLFRNRPTCVELAEKLSLDL